MGCRGRGETLAPCGGQSEDGSPLTELCKLGNSSVQQYLGCLFFMLPYFGLISGSAILGEQKGSALLQ